MRFNLESSNEGKVVMAKIIDVKGKLATRELFWQLTDATRLSEKYRVDRNLKRLQHFSLEKLKKIFIQYRFFTEYYIKDLSILISKLPAGRLKSVLGEILYEELGNGREAEAHPKLYDNFLLSMGVAEDELKNADSVCMHILEDIHQVLLTGSWSAAIGLRGMGGECLCQIYLSTMYDYFTKNSSIMAIKRAIDWRFWDIHKGEIDLHHQAVVREAIDELFKESPHIIGSVLEGYLKSQIAWDAFWLQIFKSVQTSPRVI